MCSYFLHAFSASKYPPLFLQLTGGGGGGGIDRGRTDGRTDGRRASPSPLLPPPQFNVRVYVSPCCSEGGRGGGGTFFVRYFALFAAVVARTEFSFLARGEVEEEEEEGRYFP